MRVSAINGMQFNAPKKINNVFMGMNLPYVNSVSPYDRVSFSGRKEEKFNLVDLDTAKFVANSLSTSTSGHRAKYNNKFFTPEIVQLLTLGVAEYAKNNAKNPERPVVLIGGDTRNASVESLPLIKSILTKQGIDVISIKKPVPTPLLALYAKDQDVDLAILMTASHNPWEDGGFNLVTKEGAIAPPEVTKEVADYAVKIAEEQKYITDTSKKGKSKTVFPYEIYKQALENEGLIDWANIKKSNVSVYYDSLTGTGGNVVPRLFKDYGAPLHNIKSDEKVATHQEGPNPTKGNLTELAKAVREDSNSLKIGLANDGDADRFGIVDENGNFITPNDVIMLTAYHLYKNKGLKGTIIRSQATSSQVDLFAEKYGLNVKQTPVGFKYIGEDIKKIRQNNEDILVAGEESGGLTVHGHIMEKDGIAATLLMLDLVATEKKPISQILNDIKEDIGVEYIVKASDLNLKGMPDGTKETMMDNVKTIYKNALTGRTQFSPNFEIDVPKTQANYVSMEHYKEGGDGVKLYFKRSNPDIINPNDSCKNDSNEGISLLVRPSGTEPKMKIYIEAYGDTKDSVNANINEIDSALKSKLNL